MACLYLDSLVRTAKNFTGLYESARWHTETLDLHQCALVLRQYSK